MKKFAECDDRCSEEIVRLLLGVMKSAMKGFSDTFDLRDRQQRRLSFSNSPRPTNGQLPIDCVIEYDLEDKEDHHSDKRERFEEHLSVNQGLTLTRGVSGMNIRRDQPAC